MGLAFKFGYAHCALRFLYKLPLLFNDATWLDMHPSHDKLIFVINVEAVPSFTYQTPSYHDFDLTVCFG